MIQQVSDWLIEIINWAEATICSFEQNLYMLQDFLSTLHQSNDWRQYKDHETLQKMFWQIFQKEMKDLSVKMMKVIRSARILNCLLIHEFIRRLINEQFVVFIQEDD